MRDIYSEIVKALGRKEKLALATIAEKNLLDKKF